jgi:hypothetical protein
MPLLQLTETIQHDGNNDHYKRDVVEYINARETADTYHLKVSKNSSCDFTVSDIFAANTQSLLLKSLGYSALGLFFEHAEMPCHRYVNFGEMMILRDMMTTPYYRGSHGSPHSLGSTTLTLFSFENIVVCKLHTDTHCWINSLK